MSTIYLIHASDASQHLGKIQGICESLKTETRISGYQTVEAGNPSLLTNEVKPGDMVIALLTQEMEPHKAQIENTIGNLKSQRVKVAEIIVDHVTYEKEFITFPADLKPIRAREDMDTAWGEIANQLREIFPSQGKVPIKWKKYLKYAALLVGLALVIWVGQKLFTPNGTADFDYEIKDFVTLRTIEDSVYYIPNQLLFSGKFDQPDSVHWDFGDGTTAEERNPIKSYDSAGRYAIEFVAYKNGIPYPKTKNFEALNPPVASFTTLDVCVSNPVCTINLENSSAHADSYHWDFGDNTQSDEVQPQKTYERAGDYKILLTATNSFGKTDTVSRMIQVQDRPRPFAKFSYTKDSADPKKINFKNLSQHATEFVWILGDDQVRETGGQSGFSHTYSQEGQYHVKLIAKGNNEQHEFDDVVYAKSRNWTDITIQNYNIHERATIKKEILLHEFRLNR